MARSPTESSLVMASVMGARISSSCRALCTTSSMALSVSRLATLNSNSAAQSRISAIGVRKLLRTEPIILYAFIISPF